MYFTLNNKDKALQYYNYALKLNIDGGYLLHGTNKKHGIGMMVSHGCIRLRNEDIVKLDPFMNNGMPVIIFP